MTTPELRSVIEKNTNIFVASLNGRFRNHVSDEFIKAYLNRMILLTPWAKLSRLDQAAYDAAQNLFEGILEAELGVRVNGHHIAQNYSKLFAVQEDFVPGLVLR